jgi:transcriptional regulator with XRE-family HTH domain
MDDDSKNRLQITDDDLRRRFDFGLLIREKREDIGLPLRQMAKIIGLSPSYLCDIEMGRRYPPNNKLAEIADALFLQGDELHSFYDIAALSRGDVVPHDLGDYIMQDGQARTALRVAKDGQLSPAEWEEVIEAIKCITNKTGRNIEQERRN